MLRCLFTPLLTPQVLFVPFADGPRAVHLEASRIVFKAEPAPPAASPPLDLVIVDEAHHICSQPPS